MPLIVFFPDLRCSHPPSPRGLGEKGLPSTFKCVVPLVVGMYLPPVVGKCLQSVVVFHWAVCLLVLKQNTPAANHENRWSLQEGVFLEIPYHPRIFHGVMYVGWSIVLRQKDHEHLNFLSHLLFPSAGITGIYYHAWITQCWGSTRSSMYAKQACYLLSCIPSHSLRTDLQLDGTPFVASTANIRKLQSNPLPPGICGYSEGHATVRTSVKCSGDPAEDTCQVQVACGHHGLLLSQVDGRIHHFQNCTYCCSQKILQPLCKVLQRQNPNNEVKAWKAFARLFTEQHYLEVSFTVSFLEFGQGEARKDPGQSKIGKFLSCVSNLIPFSFLTGSFVTRETSKEEVGHWPVSSMTWSETFL